MRFKQTDLPHRSRLTEGGRCLGYAHFSPSQSYHALPISHLCRPAWLHAAPPVGSGAGSSHLHASRETINWRFSFEPLFFSRSSRCTASHNPSLELFRDECTVGAVFSPPAWLCLLEDSRPRLPRPRCPVSSPAPVDGGFHPPGLRKTRDFCDSIFTNLQKVDSRPALENCLDLAHVFSFFNFHVTVTAQRTKLLPWPLISCDRSRPCASVRHTLIRCRRRCPWGK